MYKALTLFIKTSALGLTAYALVFTREVPTALAQAPIETDCSTTLDQPDTTYLLNTNVPGNCVIAADNIILDGQSLYTIGGNVTGTTTATVNFTVQNVEVGGTVSNYAGSSYSHDAGDVTIQNADIAGDVYSHGYNYNGGDVTIIDSEISGYVSSRSQYGDAGAVTVTNSTIYATVNTNGSANGAVTITGSEIQSHVASWDDTVSITDSTVGGYVFGEDGIIITNSTIDADGDTYDGGGNTLYTEASCEIIDSFVINPSQAYCETITLTDTAPSLTVTPLTLELEAGESFNPFSDASADDVLDGDLSNDIIVVGEVGEGPGTYELVYSVTDSGSTLFNDLDNATSTSGPSTASVTRTVIRPEEGGAESTRVGQRSSSSSSKDASEEAATPSTGASDIEDVLAQLKIVLSEPINTNDPEVLKKLLNLLLQLMAVVAQLASLKQ